MVNNPKKLVRLVLDQAGPDWYPVFKKHPRDNTPKEKYYVPHDRPYALVDTGNIHNLIDRSDAVLLINSTVGIEALMRGRRVITLGDAFYSGMGWTEDVRAVDSLTGAIERLGAEPNVPDDRKPSLASFLYWLIFCYFADPAAPDIERRMQIACAG